MIDVVPPQKRQMKNQNVNKVKPDEHFPSNDCVLTAFNIALYIYIGFLI